jgi:hypothetical protein
MRLGPSIAALMTLCLVTLCLVTLSLVTLCLAALCLAARPVQASTMVALTTPDLVRVASVIAVVEVQSTRTVRAGGRLTTIATLAVTDPIKGAKTNETVQVRIPGGEEGQWAQRVEGAPVLKPGEQCVVFLEPSGRDIYRFVGLEQGRQQIEPDASSSGGLMVRHTTTARLVERGPDGELHEAAPPAATEPLEPYLDRLRTLASPQR